MEHTGHPTRPAEASLCTTGSHCPRRHCLGQSSLRLLHPVFLSPPAAIKTPYLPNGKFDLEAYDALVEHQIQVGAAGAAVWWVPAGGCWLVGAAGAGVGLGCELCVGDEPDQ
jgi:hypothetical protein